MAFPAAGYRKESGQGYQCLPPLKGRGGGEGEVLTAISLRGGGAHTQRHGCSQIVPRCLIALNCGTVFSTQTSVSLAAPSTEQVGVGKAKRGRKEFLFRCVFKRGKDHI